MSQDDARPPLSPEELAAETGAALPDKEVISLLDLNADLDLALDAAAPLDAAVGATGLSVGSDATAVADQGTLIDQGITGEATANALQDSGIDQSAAPTPDPVATDTGGTGGTDVGAVPTDAGGVLDGDLLDVD